MLTATMRTERTCAAAPIADAASLRSCDMLTAAAQPMSPEWSFKATMTCEIRTAFSLHVTRTMATRRHCRLAQLQLLLAQHPFAVAVCFSLRCGPCYQIGRFKVVGFMRTGTALSRRNSSAMLFSQRNPSRTTRIFSYGECGRLVFQRR